MSVRLNSLSDDIPHLLLESFNGNYFTTYLKSVEEMKSIPFYEGPQLWAIYLHWSFNMRHPEAFHIVFEEIYCM
jgi:hypothetical protein